MYTCYDVTVKVVECLLLRQLWVLNCRLRSHSAGVEIETAPEPAGQVFDSTGMCCTVRVMS
jgi:hypothetical protein